MESPKSAESPAGTDDRAAIAAVIDVWAEASAAKNIDRYMRCFSEDYHSDILPTKAKMREYWSLAMEHGLTDELNVSFDPAEIRIDGATARTGKVRLESRTGSYTQMLVFSKEEDGIWRIIDSYT